MMGNMTWKQFKNYVDTKLAEDGVSEDTEIWFIDISYPSNKGGYKEPSVYVDKNNGIEIT